MTSGRGLWETVTSELTRREKQERGFSASGCAKQPPSSSLCCRQAEHVSCTCDLFLRIDGGGGSFAEFGLSLKQAKSGLEQTDCLFDIFGDIELKSSVQQIQQVTHDGTLK